MPISCRIYESSVWEEDPDWKYKNDNHQNIMVLQVTTPDKMSKSVAVEEMNSGSLQY
jgi:hypothetical protein